MQPQHSMSLRVRHCVECPECHTCYLIGFSPYRNGAYLVASESGSAEYYTLCCLCDGSAARLWRWQEAKACEVTSAAHHRGYGTLDEVWPTGTTQRPTRLEIARYFNARQV